jgi:DnaK suppressor protein
MADQRLAREFMQRAAGWLAHRERELIAEIRSARDAARADLQADSGAVHDAKDDAEASLQLERRAAEMQRDADELILVRAARKRLASGGYGLCGDCGGPIDDRRLAAQPAAPRCSACQERAEQAERFARH